MKIINLNNIYKELWELLGMFESKSYVCEKVSANFKEISVGELNLRIDTITSSIRQACEYFKASSKVSILTSPLLVNYGMINLAKALYYLTQEDITENYFSKHGANVCLDEYLSIADVKIEVKDFGTLISLGKCYNEKELQKKISLGTLLAQVPDIAQLYEETYNTYSKVLYSQPTKYGYNIFSTERDRLDIYDYLVNNNKDIFSKGINISMVNKIQDYSFSIIQTMAGDLSRNIIETNSNRTYINIEKDGLRYNQITISYLVIFVYSMLVRYQPNNWEKFIDNNFSKEYQLIDKSITSCKETFIIEITKLMINEDIKFIADRDNKYIEPTDLRQLYRKLKEIEKEENFVLNR